MQAVVSECVIMVPFIALRCFGRWQNAVRLWLVFCVATVAFTLLQDLLGFVPLMDPVFWVFFIVSKGNYLAKMHLWAVILVLGDSIFYMFDVVEKLMKPQM